MKIEIHDAIIEVLNKHFVGQLSGHDTIEDAVKNLLLDEIYDAGFSDKTFKEDVGKLFDKLRKEAGKK